MDDGLLLCAWRHLRNAGLRNPFSGQKGVSGLCIWLFKMSEVLFAVLRHRLLLLTRFAVHYTLSSVLLRKSACTCTCLNLVPVR